MVTVPVYNERGEVVGERHLDDRVFGVPVVPSLVQQAVLAQAANSRAPLAHTKTRAEVRGGGRKPWRQKGTGRARQGSIRAPQWRGGGVVFGPRRTRAFAVRLNKKMRRKALLMALSDRAGGRRLVVLERLAVAGKTREWQQLSRHLWTALAPGRRRAPSALVVLPSVPLSFRRSTANVPGLEVIRADSLNVQAVLGHSFTLTTVEGVERLEQWLAPRRRK